MNRRTATRVLEDLGPLERSYDSKVSPLVRRQGSKYAPRIGNAFGTLAGPLEEGGTCPGYSGPFCGSCYAASLSRIRPQVRALLERNTRRLEAARTLGEDRAAALILEMLEQFAAECDRRSIDPAARVFRPYWSGDVVDEVEARAWASAWSSIEPRGISGWQYTRTLEVVSILEAVPNLTLYVSTDVGNVDQVRPVLRAHPRVRMAACGSSISDARELHDDGRMVSRIVACPENVGRLPIVVSFSGRRSETVEIGQDGQGACIACRVCIDGRAAVAFSTSGR